MHYLTLAIRKNWMLTVRNNINHYDMVRFRLDHKCGVETLIINHRGHVPLRELLTEVTDSGSGTQWQLISLISDPSHVYTVQSNWQYKVLRYFLYHTTLSCRYSGNFWRRSFCNSREFDIRSVRISTNRKMNPYCPSVCVSVPCLPAVLHTSRLPSDLSVGETSDWRHQGTVSSSKSKSWMLNLT